MAIALGTVFVSPQINNELHTLKMNRIYFLIGVIVVFSNTTMAQIDNSSGPSTVIPAESNNNSNSGALDIKPIENKGLTNPNSNKINGMSVPESRTSSNTDEFSMFPKEKFGNPGELYEKRVKERTAGLEKKPDERLIGKTTDQYLGDFKTKGKKVTIAYRDYGEVDGDLIRIFADDDIMRAEVALGGSFTGFELELKEGFNKLDFQALNQGYSGPNTAELLVLDEGGNIIASRTWALATGVKATIIVVKE